MKSTYSIRKLIALLVNKIWLLIVTTLIFGLGAFLVSRFLISPRYESFTTMYVKNSAVTTEKEASVALNDLYASKSLASTYMTVLSSDAVMKQVGNKLTEMYEMEGLEQIFTVKDDKISIASIKKCFSMTAVNETEVIKITANTLNPDVSADMCNIMAEIAPEFLIRVVGAGSVEIIDKAVPEKTPVSPNVKLISLIGAIIGLSFAVFLVLLFDYFDDTVKDTEELSQKFNKAILGEVQMIDVDRTKNKKKSKNASVFSARALLTDEGIPFNVVESYKTIRSNIVFTLGTSQKKVIAVSSANPGEGKSTTAANIAIALAQTGSSVLLIDADMRKPVQHKIFKMSNSEGL
jgi:Capsular polysaccharide biosynthesis protein